MDELSSAGLPDSAEPALDATPPLEEAARGDALADIRVLWDVNVADGELAVSFDPQNPDPHAKS